jgi:hypothetical protein
VPPPAYPVFEPEIDEYNPLPPATVGAAAPAPPPPPPILAGEEGAPLLPCEGDVGGVFPAPPVPPPAPPPPAPTVIVYGVPGVTGCPVPVRKPPAPPPAPFVRHHHHLQQLQDILLHQHLVVV